MLCLVCARVRTYLHATLRFLGTLACKLVAAVLFLPAARTLRYGFGRAALLYFRGNGSNQGTYGGVTRRCIQRSSSQSAHTQLAVT